MMQKHTPGPWMYTLDARGVCGIHQANCETGMSVRIGEVIAETQAQAEANARLIAAAPDMLEALQYQQMADYDPEASERKGYFERARELRRAAIIKAGGKL